MPRRHAQSPSNPPPNFKTLDGMIATFDDDVAGTNFAVDLAHVQQDERAQCAPISATREDMIAMLRTINAISMGSAAISEKVAKIKKYYLELRNGKNLMPAEEIQKSSFFSSDIPLVVWKLLEFSFFHGFSYGDGEGFRFICAYLQEEKLAVKTFNQRDLLIKILNLMGGVTSGSKQKEGIIKRQRKFILYFATEFITVTNAEYQWIEKVMNASRWVPGGKEPGIIIKITDVQDSAEVRRELLRIYTIIFACCLQEKPTKSHCHIITFGNDGESLRWFIPPAALASRPQAKRIADNLLSKLRENIDEVAGATPSEEIRFAHFFKLPPMPLPSDPPSYSYPTRATMFSPPPVLPPLSDFVQAIEEQHKQDAASVLSAISSEPIFSAGSSALTMFTPVQSYSTSDPSNQYAGDKRGRSIDPQIEFCPTRNVRSRADAPAEPKTGPVTPS